MVDMRNEHSHNNEEALMKLYSFLSTPEEKGINEVVFFSLYFRREGQCWW